VGPGIKELAIKGTYLDRASESAPSSIFLQKGGFGPVAGEREILLNPWRP